MNDERIETISKAFNEAFEKYGDYEEARRALFIMGKALEIAIPRLKLDQGLHANKAKSELNLAPHEWASIHKQVETITKNGANSIRHLEGCVLIIMEAIKERK